MRRSALGVVLAVLVVSSVAAGAFILYTKQNGADTSTARTTPNTPAGSAAIILANLSSSYHSIFLVIKNTGTANLLFLGTPTVSPSGGTYCETSGWNPTPAGNNPIYRGESVKGNCILKGPTLKVGAQVTVSVPAGFSDGSSSLLSAAVIVVP